MPKSNKTLLTLTGSILIVISALMFGSYGVFSKWLLPYAIFYQTYVRCLLVALILGIYGVYKNQFKRVEKKDVFWFAVMFTFTLLSIAPIMYAFRYLTLGTASFLFYSSLTIFTYIFGFLFFKEKITVVKLCSLVLSFLGMLAIFSFNFSVTLLLPAAMAILNGLASSGEITFSKKISSKYSSTQITALVFLLIGISHFFISLLLHESQDPGLFTQSLPTLLLFTFVAIVGMITVVEGFKRVEPSIGAIIGLLEIVFSALFGYLLFQEHSGLNVIIGGVLIIVAAALPNVMEMLGVKKSKLVSSK